MLIIYLLIPFIPSKKDETDPEKNYSWMPSRISKEGESLIWCRMTPKKLRKYDGVNDERVLLGIRKKIYDVTSGKGFYGPGGPYGNFAGRDASRGLAKQSFDDDMLSDPDGVIDALNDLTDGEWSNLRDWESHFKGKYILCGDLIEN